MYIIKKANIKLLFYMDSNFIELNFTVAFLLIRKTWDDRFTVKVGEWGILRNGGRGLILKLAHVL